MMDFSLVRTCEEAGMATRMGIGVACKTCFHAAPETMTRKQGRINVDRRNGTYSRNTRKRKGKKAK